MLENKDFKKNNFNMKGVLLFIFILLINRNLIFSQVAINIDGSTPNNSAILDLKSNNKGFLPPRMTRAELNAIASPANGLIVYCTDCGTGSTGTLSMYMAGFWFSLSATNMDLIVTTTQLSSITSSTALCGGNVVSNGGASVTARGVCWATAQNPTIANSKTSDGEGNGIFTSSLTGCLPGTTYYVRAYATTIYGTVYGNELVLQLNSSQRPYFNYFRYNDSANPGSYSYQTEVSDTKDISNVLGTITLPYVIWSPLVDFTFKYDILKRDQASTITKVEILNGSTVLGINWDGNTTGSITLPKTPTSLFSSLTVKVTDSFSTETNLLLNTNFVPTLGVTVSNVRIATSNMGTALITFEGTGTTADPYLIERTGMDLSYHLSWTMTKNNDIDVTNINFSGTPILTNLTGESLTSQDYSPVVFLNSDATTICRIGVSAKGNVSNIFSSVVYSSNYQLRDKLYCGFLPSADIAPTQDQIISLQERGLKTSKYIAPTACPDNALAGVTLKNNTGGSAYFAWAVPTYSNSQAPPSYSKSAWIYALGSWYQMFNGFDVSTYYVKTSGANPTWYWVCIYKASCANNNIIKAILAN